MVEDENMQDQIRYLRLKYAQTVDENEKQKIMKQIEQLELTEQKKTNIKEQQLLVD